MRKWMALLFVAALLFCSMLPTTSFTEDRDTILLARTIYALGRNEDYDTKLALGTVVMNRVDSSRFSGDLGDVLRDQQQFPAGSRYDSESLDAAHAVLSGRRALDSDALFYQPADASMPWNSDSLVASSGNYNFYAESGNR